MAVRRDEILGPHLRHVDSSRLLLLLPPRPFRLALLQPGHERRRDEDRGVGAGADADDEREREALQRLAAEEVQRGGSSVMKVVASERRIVSQSETFAIVRIDARRIAAGSRARGRG